MRLHAVIFFRPGVPWTSGLLVSGALLVGLLTGCAPPEDEAAQAAALADLDLTEIAHDVRMLQTELGVPQWEIEASRVISQADSDQRTDFPEGMTIRVFDEAGTISSTLTANRGAILDGGETVLAEGDVVIVSAEGERLETEELTWDKAAHELFTESFVTIRTQDEIIYGHGFEARDDLSRYTIRDISGTVSLRE